MTLRPSAVFLVSLLLCIAGYITLSVSVVWSQSQSQTVVIQGTLYEGLGDDACYPGVSYATEGSGNLTIQVTVSPVPESGGCESSRSIDTQNEEYGGIHYVEYSCTYSFTDSDAEKTFTFMNMHPTGFPNRTIVGDPGNKRPYQKIIVPSVAPVIPTPSSENSSASCSVEGETNNTVTLDPASLSVNMSVESDTIEIDQDLILTNRVPWAKLKNASFAGIDELYNSIPWNVTQFDRTDTSLENDRRIFNTGIDAGAITSVGVGGSSSVPGLYTGAGHYGVRRDSDDWKNLDYSMNQSMLRSLFYEYVSSRKEVRQVNALNYQLIISNSGIYRYGTENSPLDLTITSNTSIYDEKDIMLYVTGTLTISDDFTPSNSNTVLLAPRVVFSPGVEEVDAIVIGQVVSLDSQSSSSPFPEGLKISGNLISADYFVNNRMIADNSSPSLFIEFDPNTYVEMLPYLSTSRYIWRTE